MVVIWDIMDEDDDLEALRLAALQTIRPRSQPRKNHGSQQKSYSKIPFVRPKANPNLIAIVPSEIAPSPETTPTVAQSLARARQEKVKEEVKSLQERDSAAAQKENSKPNINLKAKSSPATKVKEVKPLNTSLKKTESLDESVFELEEDVLDFDTESLEEGDDGGGGGKEEGRATGGTDHVQTEEKEATEETDDEEKEEEDLLQLHDSDSDSLEKLMEDIEKELSGVKPTTAVALRRPKTFRNRQTTKKVTPPVTPASESKSKKVKPLPKQETKTSRGKSPVKATVQPKKKSPSPQVVKAESVIAETEKIPRGNVRLDSPPKRAVSPKTRSPIRKRSASPPPMRKRSTSPPPIRKRSTSPPPIRKRSLSPIRRRSPSPFAKRPLSPYRKRSPLSPIRKRSPSPYRKRSPSPPLRRRSPSPRGWRSPLRRRSPSPRRYSPLPRKLSPRRRSISPRRFSPPRRRSISPRRRRSISPHRWSPPRRRSPSPRKRRTPSPQRKRSFSPLRLKQRSPSPAPRKRSPLSPPPPRGLRRSPSPPLSSPNKRIRPLSPDSKRPRNQQPLPPSRSKQTFSNSTSGRQPLPPAKSSHRGGNKDSSDRKNEDVKASVGKKRFNEEDEKNGDDAPVPMPLDPKLEARKRKFENNYIIESVNKKIRLKNEDSNSEAPLKESVDIEKRDQDEIKVSGKMFSEKAEIKKPLKERFERHDKTSKQRRKDRFPVATVEEEEKAKEVSGGAKLSVKDRIGRSSSALAEVKKSSRGDGGRMDKSSRVEPIRMEDLEELSEDEEEEEAKEVGGGAKLSVKDRIGRSSSTLYEVKKSSRGGGGRMNKSSRVEPIRMEDLEELSEDEEEEAKDISGGAKLSVKDRIGRSSSTLYEVKKSSRGGGGRMDKSSRVEPIRIEDLEELSEEEDEAEVNEEEVEVEMAKEPSPPLPLFRSQLKAKTKSHKRKRIVVTEEIREEIGGDEEDDDEVEEVTPRVVSRKKKKSRSGRKEVELTRGEEPAKGSGGGGDLRAELSRRRAERLKGGAIDPMARIVQSALEGAVGKIKSKSRERASSPADIDISPPQEKKSRPKGRRVFSVMKSSKSEGKKSQRHDTDDDDTDERIRRGGSGGIRLNRSTTQLSSPSPPPAHSSPPPSTRPSGRSILRRNQLKQRAFNINRPSSVSQ